jgi:glycosyltransferase involved in cell wall biosynthesis
VKICLLLPYPVFGAAEDYALILARGLSRLLQVGVVVAHYEGSLSAAEIEGLSDANVTRLPLDGSVMSSVPKLRRALGPVQQTILHVNQPFLPGIATGASLPHVATVVTAHNPALQPVYSRRGRLLSKVAERRVDAWIVLSRRNEQLLRTSLARVKSVSLIAPGLPTARFAKALSRSSARDKLGLPAGAFIVGTAGRLARQKRHDLLIRAAGRILNRVPNLHVAILGEGDLLAETEQLGSDLLKGRLHLLGHRADVPSLLPAFDVFALPSDYEGLSFAMLEAMALGLPIIATDVQGSGEALHKGDNGLLIENGSVEQLASAIECLAHNDRLAKALGKRAAETFWTYYTSDRMVEETYALYREVTR